MKIVDDRPEKSPITIKRKIPTMPEGYYSDDKPNPNLRKFVEDHLKEHPYDSKNDDYNVPAFDKPIETTKATAIYNMHTYWSKKPHDAIRQYIRHYTKPGDLVLDPFCGSGGTALAALMEGRAAIAIDLSPAATFITKNYCTPVAIQDLQEAFVGLEKRVKPEIDWLYETKCDRCGGTAITMYTVYSQVFQCPKCLKKVPLFDCIEVEVPVKVQKVGEPQKMKKANACPYCYENGHVEVIRSQSKKFGAIPVLVDYVCKNGCKPARDQRCYNDKILEKKAYFEKYDLSKINDIEKREIPYFYPKDKFMTAFSRYQRDALFYYGVKEVSDLFTKRNLWALSIILHYSKEFSKVSDYLIFALTSIMFSVSRMYLWTKDGQHGIISGTYYLPQNCREINVWTQYPDKIKSIIKLQNTILKTSEIIISSSSATSMEIPTNSIDYIFTDPPYAGKFQYGELNYVWESWLGFSTEWHDKEITINETRNISEQDWNNNMLISMNECYRILKPGRWISLCYHDTSEGSWASIQDIMANAGFIIDNSDSALYLDSIKKTFNQYTADKVTKRDLVINFRKPFSGEVSSSIAIVGNEDETTFNQKVSLIIRDYLSAHPGATKDRIYDEVVSRMVRKGQMEAHNFDTLLGVIAESSASSEMTSNGQRWYLKETELSALDAAETEKEDAAAEKVGKYISEYLIKHPDQEGVHYSDLFEYFVYSVKDKPRRPLAEWLLDYFYKTETGTYRLPITEEEKQIKKEGRSKGVSRRIKHYIAQIEQGVAIQEKNRPNDATLTEWLRHCRRAGMYEQGKLLFEKGGIRLDTLSEEQQVAVEEDYEVCVRMLSRMGATSSETKRGNRRKDVIQL